ncbi:MAG: VOC family protein [Gammaproteobacteria bacterium]
MINSVHHVSLIISDLEKSRVFYQNILGLTVVEDRPDLGFEGLWLKVGEQQIHLLLLDNPDPVHGRPQHGGRDRHVACTVTDFEQLVDRLEQGNVSYTLSRSGRKALFCRDPDGNALEFIGV